jgi:hypothetical protein
MGNLSFENVLPLIISLGESDSEFDWDFDAGNDDSEFSNEIMEVEMFCSFLSWTNILQKDSNKVRLNRNVLVKMKNSLRSY